MRIDTESVSEKSLRVSCKRGGTDKTLRMLAELDGPPTSLNALRELRCPRCENTLVPEDDGYRCATCDFSAPLKNGVFRFDGGIESEHPVTTVRALLRGARVDMDQSVRRFLRDWDGRPILPEELMGVGSAGWQFLLPMSNSARLLVLGSDWGSIPYSLARLSGHVVACDTHWEKLEFLTLRADKGQLTNLDAICVGGNYDLPLPASSIDAAVLNLSCILEEASNWSEERVLAILEQLRDILTPDGVIFSLVRTAFGWDRLLARGNDKAYSSERSNNGAHERRARHRRNLSEGRISERRLYDLFRSAGLDVHRVFVPLPDERRVRSITPRDDRTALANAVRRPSVRRREIIEQRIKGWLTAALPNAVAVLAGRGDHAAFLDRLRDHLQRESGLEDMRVSGYRINSEMGMSTLFLEADDGPAYILKLPTHDRAEEELRGEVSLLSSIHAQDHQLSQLSGLVPTVVTSGLFDGQFFAVYSLIEGRDGERLLRSGRDHDAILSGGIDVAVRLYKEGGVGRGQGSHRDRVYAAGDRVASLASGTSEEEAVGRAVDLVDRFITEEPDVGLGFGHGDLKAANIMFDADTHQVTGILDWGASEAAELRGYDAQFFLLDYCVRTSTLTLPEVIATWLRADCIEHRAQPYVHRFFESAGGQLHLNTWRSLVAYQWLRRLEPLAGPYETERFNLSYLGAMFDVFAE